jgi:hypothetical protein
MDISNYDDWLWHPYEVRFLFENVSSKFDNLHDLALLHRAFFGHELFEQLPVRHLLTRTVGRKEQGVRDALVYKRRQVLNGSVIEGVWQILHLNIIELNIYLI